MQHCTDGIDKAMCYFLLIFIPALNLFDIPCILLCHLLKLVLHVNQPLIMIQ